MAHLHIQPSSDDIADMYRTHGTYHVGDAGLDLYVVKDQEIKPGESTFIDLGINVAAFSSKDSAKNVSWLLFPRSSISKTPLRLSNSVGLIDSGYRGKIMVAVDNIKDKSYTVRKGDRIVQAVAFSGEGVSFELVEKLNETERGANGFGSTSNDFLRSDLNENASKIRKLEEDTTCNVSCDPVAVGVSSTA